MILHLVFYLHLGPATIAFVQSSYTVVEGSGAVVLCVEITGLPTGGLGSDITVDFNIIAGTIASTYILTTQV